MKKLLLSFCMFSAMILGSGAVFAAEMSQDWPCIKPGQSNASTISRYESCMAASSSAQKQTTDSAYRYAIRKAEAAMEQAQDF